MRRPPARLGVGGRDNGGVLDGTLLGPQPAPGAPVRRVRVLCRDDADRLLLLKWRDPLDGRAFYEPPGGGLEDGESPADAARRELYEETGLEPELSASFVVVWRDHTWKGRRREEGEGWFLADCGTASVVSPAGLTDSERMTLVGWEWVRRGALALLDAPAEPASVFDVLDVLVAGVLG